MKKTLLKILLLIFVFLAFSCKNEKSINEDKLINKTTDILKPKIKEDLDTLKLISWRSRIAWRGFALNKSHTGKIKIDSGYIVVNKDLKIRGGEFYMDMTSINVVDLKGKEKEDLESHLKGTIKGKENHFFNTQKYPTAKFIVVDNYIEEGVNILEGDLKLKNVENQVEGFPITFTKEEKTITLNAANFKINRTDWGINYASSSFFDDLKENVINDDFVVNIKAVFANK